MSPQLATRGALGALLVLCLAACGHQATHDSAVRRVSVTERDFAIRAPHRLAPGPVRFVVENNGPVSHELILIRAPEGLLPIRADGLTVDEKALDSATVGVLEPAGPGGSRRLDVTLTPGRYVLLCNMAGHYMSGMSADLEVT